MNEPLDRSMSGDNVELESNLNSGLEARVASDALSPRMRFISQTLYCLTSARSLIIFISSRVDRPNQGKYSRTNKRCES